MDIAVSFLEKFKYGNRNRDAFYHDFERIGCVSTLHAREKDKSSGEEGGSDIWCHGKNGKERELSRAPFV